MKDVEETVRYQRCSLPARLTSYQDSLVLDFRGDKGAWRIVEVRSQTGRPFEVLLEITLSGGIATSVRMTVASATRVSVMAKNVTVKARNLSSVSNELVVLVADGFQPTQNVFEERGETDANGTQDFAIPTFAQSVRIELATPSAIDGATVSILDADGTIRTCTSIASQPEHGVSLGGASSVRLTTSQATAWRVLFYLSM